MSKTIDKNVNMDNREALKKALDALKKARQKLDSYNAERNEPIAIVSMACKFPGGADAPDKFWDLLKNQVDAIEEVGEDRWSNEEWYSKDKDNENSICSKFAGLIDGLADFDAEFFNITPREAVSLDPQQRLILETAWEALENAGIPPVSLQGTNTAVYIGATAHDYADLLRDTQQNKSIDAYYVSGNALNFISGRLSYFLGLKGPSMAIDTACSSSLTAVHLACQSLRSYESSLSIVGGVNLILSPEVSLASTRSNLLSVDGRCKTFDASANGIVRSEGCGVIILQRVSDAVRDGNTILALIKGSAINQDGSSSGLMAPNLDSQVEVLRAALKNAGLTISDIDYIEAHGTGTGLGDPVEVRAIAELLKAENRKTPLLLGSVKANIGHLESASGMAGIIKTILSMRHGVLPAQLHFTTPSPYIDWASYPIQVVTSQCNWPRSGAVSRAGVSAFGGSGSNAHVILESAPVAETYSEAEGGVPVLLAVSAKSDLALQTAARKLADYLLDDSVLNSISLGSIARMANSGRQHFEYRKIVMADNHKSLADLLLNNQLIDDENSLVVQKKNPAKKPTVAFLFTGQGAQYAQMGKHLYDHDECFRNSINQCDKALENILEFSLVDLLWGNHVDRLNDTQYTQPAMFSFEYALAQSWLMKGIKPDVVIGHSIGEVAAACIAGMLSFDDAIHLIQARGALMVRHCQTRGGMLAVRASQNQFSSAQLTGLSIAAVNAKDSTVVAGDEDALDKLVVDLQGQSIRTQRLNVSHAFHSHLMQPMLAEFSNVINDIVFYPAKIPFISTVDGRVYENEVLPDEYWVRHVQQPVLFADAVTHLKSFNCKLLLEIGPDATLLGLAAKTLDDGFTFLASQKKGGNGFTFFQKTLAKLYTEGLAVDWSTLYGKHDFPAIALPNYSFQKRRYWPLDKGVARSRSLSLNHCYKTVWKVLDDIAQPTLIEQVKDGNYCLFFSSLTSLTDKVASETVAETCLIKVVYADNFDKQSENLITMDPSNEDHWRQLRVCLNAISIDSVIYDCSYAVDAEIDAPQVYQQCINLSRVVSLSLDVGLRGRIYLIKSYTDKASDKALALAGIRGFSHSCMLEMPQLWGGLFEYDEVGLAFSSAVSDMAARIKKKQAIAWLRYQGGQSLVPSIAREDALPSGPFAIHKDRSYLVSGGFGEVAFRLIESLYSLGARYFIIVSRRTEAALIGNSSGNDVIKRIAALRDRGATVEVVSADVADQSRLKAGLDTVRSLLPSIAGVFHAAGVVSLCDSSALGDYADLASIIEVKTSGAWNLHCLTRDDPLDCFVMFSSISSAWGAPRMAHYAMANAYMDELALYRKNNGLPALSINWGPLAGGGMADSEHGERLSLSGIHRLSIDKTMDYLLKLSIGQQANAIVTNVDWNQFVAALESRLGSQPMIEWFDSLCERDVQTKKEVIPEEKNTILSNLQGQPRESRIQYILAGLSDVFKSVLHLSKSQYLDKDQALHEFGIDSLMALEVRDRLQSIYGIAFSATLIFDYPTANDIADFIDKKLFADLSQTSILHDPSFTRNINDLDNEVAIIGIGCRFPGGSKDAQTFWAQLCNGKDGITDSPLDRWNIEDYLDSSGNDESKAYVLSAGLLEDIDCFDAEFFGIGPREARLMDPQQRIALEVVWHALEHAGISPSSLKDSKTGVYFGVADNEYSELIKQSGEYEDDFAYLGTGNKLNVIAGRISYLLGLQGPSLVIDTACSSSAVATHLACRSLRQGESDLAIAGGVNIILDAQTFVSPCKAKMLAPDGRCKTFDAKADGYVRSEGCGVIVLKRFQDAKRDGDRVIAIIKGSAVNQDGRSSSLTAPNGQAQESVIRTALIDAGKRPDEIGYIETHGTGTSLGDPIEFNTLGRIYGDARSESIPLYIGAAKSVLGHCEAAAGIAGIIKTALVLQNKHLPANLHFEQANPSLEISENIRIVDHERLWTSSQIRTAAVSAFGFSGTNAHLILQEAPAEVAKDSVESVPNLLLVSAKTQAQFSLLLKRYAESLEFLDNQRFKSFCETTCRGREHFEYRAAYLAKNASTMCDLLKGAARVDACPQTLLRLRCELLPGFDAFNETAMTPQSKVFSNRLNNLNTLIDSSENSSACTDALSFLAFVCALDNFGLKIDEVIVSEGITNLVIGMYAAGFITLKDCLRFISQPDLSWNPEWQTPRVRLLAADGKDISKKEDLLACLQDKNLLGEQVFESREGVCEISLAQLSSLYNQFGDMHTATLQWLADIYTLGAQINWSSVFDRRSFEVPVYPMLKKRFWPFTGFPLVPSAGFGTGKQNKNRHYLLGEKMSLPRSNSIRFSSVFSKYAPAYINDHRLLDTMVVPAASHISMILSAAKELTGKDACIVEDLCLFQPLILADHDNRSVQLILEPYDGGRSGTYDVELISLEPGGEADDANAWMTHAKARLYVAVGDLDNSVPISLTASLEEWSETISRESFYEQFWEHGYTLGESFCWLGKGWVKDGQTLRKIHVPKIDDPINQLQLHPGLIDTCFSVLSSGQLEWTEQHDHEEMFIPVNIDRIEFVRQSGSADELYAYAKAWNQDATEKQRRKEDIALFDAQGIVARIIGFETRKAQREALKAGFKRHYRDDVYREAWINLGEAVSENRHLSANKQIVCFGHVEPGIDKHSVSFHFINVNIDEVDSIPVLQEQLSAKLGSTDALLIFDNKETNALSCLNKVIAVLKAVLGVLDEGRIHFMIVSEFGNDSHAALQGFLRGLMSEHPNASVQCIEADNSYALNKVIEYANAWPHEPRILIRNNRVYGARLERLHQAHVYPPYQCDSQKTYIITGGMGGVGQSVMHWLLRSGAKSIVLCGRRMPDKEKQAQFEYLGSSYHADIHLCPVDIVTDNLRSAVNQLTDKAIGGIIHAAGVAQDDLVVNQTSSHISQVMSVKIIGAQKILQTFSNDGFDFMLVFSSLAAQLPAHGQSVYAAANAWLDAWAKNQRENGKPIFSIAWGPWDEVGMTSGRGQHFKHALQRMGIEPLLEEAAMDMVSQVLQGDEGCALVADIDWKLFLSSRQEWKDDIYLQALWPSVNKQSEKDEVDDLKKILQSAQLSQRKSILIKHLRPIAASVLGMADQQLLKPDKALFELGLDSIAAMDLRSELQTLLNCNLRATLLFDYPTLDKLASYILSEVLKINSEEDDKNDIGDQIEAMTEEEAEAMLLAELGEEI